MYSLRTAASISASLSENAGCGRRYGDSDGLSPAGSGYRRAWSQTATSPHWCSILSRMRPRMNLQSTEITKFGAEPRDQKKPTRSQLR